MIYDNVICSELDKSLEKSMKSLVKEAMKNPNSALHSLYYAETIFYASELAQNEILDKWKKFTLYGIKHPMPESKP